MTTVEVANNVIDVSISTVPPTVIRQGSGLPAGGTTGQVATKLSDVDDDVGWADPAGGGGDVNVVSFTQSSPSLTWTIAHNLGRAPVAVTVTLLSGEIVEPDRHDTDLNTTVLTFSTLAAGTAELI